MVVKVYCGRLGCGKLIGARDFSPEGRVLEEEWEEGVVTDVDGVKFCSQECCDKKNEFVTPEEIADVI